VRARLGFAGLKELLIATSDNTTMTSLQVLPLHPGEEYSMNVRNMALSAAGTPRTKGNEQRGPHLRCLDDGRNHLMFEWLDDGGRPLLTALEILASIMTSARQTKRQTMAFCPILSGLK